MTSSQPSYLPRFRELICRENVPLAEAALNMSGHCQQANLSVGIGLERLDSLSREVPEASLDGVVQFLFGELGFAGDDDNYFDSQNSYLDRVLERRLGIPISLAVLTIEIASRCDVLAHGVGMPGHFLILEAERPNRLIDPFRGEFISREEAERLFSYLNPTAEFLPDYLSPVDDVAILNRMLNNLRSIHSDGKSVSNLIPVLELLMCFDQPRLDEVRQLAALLDAQGKPDIAARQLEEVADRNKGEYAQQLHQLVTQLWRRLN